MIKPFILFSAGLLMGLGGCQPESSTPAVAAPANLVVAAPRPAPDELPPAEQVTDDMLVFEGLPAGQLPVAQLTRQLGQPDSIARGAVECGSQLDVDLTVPGDFWYYSRSRYAVARNQAALEAMDVRSGRFHGKLGSLVLNQSTTLQDVARVFPNAARRVGPATESTALQQVSFTFLLKNGETADGELWLIFDRGQLISVNHWFAC